MVFKVILEYEWMSSSASHSFTGPLGPYSGDRFFEPQAAWMCNMQKF